MHLVGNDADTISADVSGSERYRVILFLQGGKLHYQCDCPVNANGESCCKHVVAVALAAAHGHEGAPPAAASAGNSLRAYLHSLSAETLADMLQDIAASDPDVERRLRFRQQLSAEPDLESLKKTIAGLIGRLRFLDYRRSREFAGKIADIGTMLRQTLSAGQAGLCVRLCDHAFERLIKVYEQSDDSGGHMGGAIGEIGEIFHEACLAAAEQEKPKPARFLQLLLMAGWGFISGFDTADMLGEHGAAALETTIESAWQKLPENPANEFDSRRVMLKQLMEKLAASRGDIDLLIRIYGRDLKHAHGHQKIVDLCRQHGREREAVLWAERGVRAHPKDAQLRCCLAAMYRRDGLEREALEQVWQAFLCTANSQAYLRLKEYAGDAWPLWREKALTAIAKAERPPPSYGARTDTRPDGSLRASCLLAEGSMEETRNLLQTHVFSESVRLAIAHAIRQVHPEEAVAQVKSVIDQTLLRTGPSIYHKAVELLAEKCVAG